MDKTLFTLWTFTTNWNNYK